jgi:hypothetical protein
MWQPSKCLDHLCQSIPSSFLSPHGHVPQDGSVISRYSSQRILTNVVHYSSRLRIYTCNHVCTFITPTVHIGWQIPTNKMKPAFIQYKVYALKAYCSLHDTSQDLTTTFEHPLALHNCQVTGPQTHNMRTAHASIPFSRLDPGQALAIRSHVCH